MRNVNTHNYATVSEAAQAQAEAAAASKAAAEALTSEPNVLVGQTVEVHVSNLSDDEAAAAGGLLVLGLTEPAARGIAILGLANDPESDVVFHVSVSDDDDVVYHDHVEVSKEWVLANVDLIAPAILADPLAALYVLAIGGTIG